MKKILTHSAATGALAVAMVLLPAVEALAADVPNPPADAPGEVKSKINVVIGFMKYGGMIAILIGVLIAVYVLAIGGSRGSGGRDGVEKLGYVAAAAILLGSSSAVVGFLI